MMFKGAVRPGAVSWVMVFIMGLSFFPTASSTLVDEFNPECAKLTQAGKKCGERGEQAGKKKRKKKKYIAEGQEREVTNLIVIHATGGPYCGCKVKGKGRQDCYRGNTRLACTDGNEKICHDPGWVKGKVESGEDIMRIMLRKRSPDRLKKGKKTTKVSYHYIIDKKGNTLSWIKDDQVAYHAGAANQTSISIALINHGDGKDKFGDAQLGTLMGLLKKLMKKYKLKSAQIKGHYETDNSTISCNGQKYKRKIDPGGTYRAGKGNLSMPALRAKLK